MKQWTWKQNKYTFSQGNTLYLTYQSNITDTCTAESKADSQIEVSVDASWSVCQNYHIYVPYMWNDLYYADNTFVYSIYSMYIAICMCVILLGILYKWVGRVAVLINLLLLKQSKCKLDLSICVSQTIMSREFKWPGCFSSILTQS